MLRCASALPKPRPPAKSWPPQTPVGGLPCATTWRTHIAPRGALWPVSGSVAAHPTHLRAFEVREGHFALWPVDLHGSGVMQTGNTINLSPLFISGGKRALYLSISCAEGRYLPHEYS